MARVVLLLAVLVALAVAAQAPAWRRAATALALLATADVARAWIAPLGRLHVQPWWGIDRALCLLWPWAVVLAVPRGAHRRADARQDCIDAGVNQRLVERDAAEGIAARAVGVDPGEDDLGPRDVEADPHGLDAVAASDGLEQGEGGAHAWALPRLVLGRAALAAAVALTLAPLAACLPRGAYAALLPAARLAALLVAARGLASLPRLTSVAAGPALAAALLAGELAAALLAVWADPHQAWASAQALAVATYAAVAVVATLSTTIVTRARAT